MHHATVLVFSSLTLYTVLQANANSLQASVKNPRRGSPHPQRHVIWELDHVILPPLRIIRNLLQNCAVSDALTGIELLVIDTLGFSCGCSY